MSPAVLARGMERRAWQRDIAWCRREATRLVVVKLELALLLSCDVVIPECER